MSGNERKHPAGMAEQRAVLSLGELVWWLLISFLVLYGVLFIYSTGYISEDYPVRATWTRHIVWCGTGVLLAWGASRLTAHGLAMRWLTWAGYVGSLLLLTLVLVFGTTIGGARRWLVIGSLMLQPAEFAKVFTMLAVCRLASPDGDLARKWWRYFLLLPIIGVPFALIVVEPSFGNAFSLLPGSFAVLGVRFAWRPLWTLVMLLLIVGLVGGGIMLTRVRSGEGLSMSFSQENSFFRSYHLSRMANYLTPAGGWNERQSMMTLASGGMTGKGYLNGTMKSLGYLPRTVAPTDFIFSVIGEEMGFAFGSLPVLLAYMILVAIGLHWGAYTKDGIAMLNCVALMTLVCTHVLVNVGMTVRLIPVIGLPLPFLSYGGSFTLSMFLALGFVWGVGRRNAMQSKERIPIKVAESEFCINLLNLFKLTIKTKP
ncbi:MAG: FtsW/RodA/SpoVE family cell cycle protein [Victivallales bacterium]|nr:FtsW/RodA/SpoVE family cell cycle protein [Victivallales bacterium]